MKPEAKIDAREWVRLICEELVNPVLSVERFKLMCDQHDLKGMQAEATVRNLVERFVVPLRVSHGTILHEDNAAGNKAPELDLIIWQPSPLPPMFEVGSFAIVPRGSAVGMMEIKRSNYNGEVGSKIKEKLDLADSLVWNYDGLLKQMLELNQRALGVVCLRDTTIKDEILDRLVAEGAAVVLLEAAGTGSKLTARTADVLKFANYLLGIRQRARILDGSTRLFMPGEC